MDDDDDDDDDHNGDDFVHEMSHGKEMCGGGAEVGDPCRLFCDSAGRQRHT